MVARIKVEYSQNILEVVIPAPEGLQYRYEIIRKVTKVFLTVAFRISNL